MGGGVFLGYLGIEGLVIVNINSNSCILLTIPTTQTSMIIKIAFFKKRITVHNAGMMCHTSHFTIILLQSSMMKN